MRYPILKKDDTFAVGFERIAMDPNVVELPEMVSLWWNHNYDDLRGPYGTLTDLRVEDGEITGELRVYDPTWTDETMQDIGCRLHGCFTNIAFESNLDTKESHIAGCKLRAVSVMLEPPFGANPGSRI